MSDSGYLSLEVDQLVLAFAAAGAPVGDEQGDLPVRLDLELVNHMDVFKWSSSSDSKASAGVFKASRQPGSDAAAPADVGEGEAEAAAAPPVVFTLGFPAMQLRTTYIDLNVDVMSALANAMLSIKVVIIGATEEVVELCLPLFAVLTAPGASISARSAFSEISTPLSLSVTLPSDSSIVGAESWLTWRLLCDNDMTEFCVGSCVLQCEKSSLVAPPASWGLHYADVIDPKAKVPPTAEQLRAAWLEAIPKMVDAQSKYATYRLSIGGTAPAVAVSEGDEGESAAAEGGASTPLLPVLSVPSGKLSFDAEAAAAVPPEVDIRTLPHLWSVSWTESPKLLLTRQTLRVLGSALTSSATLTTALTVPVTVSKVPTADGVASEGDQTLNACASLELTPLAAVGCLGAELPAELAGAGFVSAAVAAEDAAAAATAAAAAAAERGEEPAAAAEGTEPVVPVFSVSLSLSSPIVTTAPALAVDVLPRPPLRAATSNAPAAAAAAASSSGSDSDGANALADLRKEVAATVRAIAQEYVMQYPQGMGTAGAEGRSASANGGESSSSAAAAVSTMSDRKAEFLHFLSTNGAYHSFKEALKPKIQRVARHLYGPRGQALGRSPLVRAGGVGAPEGGEADPAMLDRVLSELYVVLVRESNAVMAEMFSETVVARDALLEESASNASNASGGAPGNAGIDDERETLLQKHARLLALADDAEADGRIRDAEDWHLERLVLCSASPRLSAVPALVHHGHDQLARFYLRQAAAAMSSSSSSSSSSSGSSSGGEGDAAAGYLRQAREALELAVAADPAPSQWPTVLLLGAVLVELGQATKGQELLRLALARQAPACATLGAFSDFDGYDSDSLCNSTGDNSVPSDPLVFAVLAAVFSAGNHPVRARKALRLASRCFALGNHLPPLATHGSPKRTLVLLLAKASSFLTLHACKGLAAAAHGLAVDCEAAVTAKAQAKGLAAATPPFIRTLLRIASSQLRVLQGGRGSEAMTEAEGAVLVAIEPADVVSANLAFASACLAAGGANEASQALGAFLKAVNAASAASCPASIAPRHYLAMLKLLSQAGRLDEGYSVACIACAAHTTSASLLLQLGACCLRLDRVEDSEDALCEANVLDNRNAGVWAHLSLLCLTFGKSISRPPRVAASLLDLDPLSHLFTFSLVPPLLSPPLPP